MESERLAKEFLLWLSGLRTRLVSMRMQVPSLALLRGLRIPCCCELWCKLQRQLRFSIVVAVVVGWQVQLRFNP